MESIADVVSRYGAQAKAKLSNPSVKGEPEDQLRRPFETLLSALAEATGFAAGDVVSVGESSLADLKTRPDYAVTVKGAIAGFIEMKAPGKGADPRRFRDRHDKDQWERLRALPNLIYTDGNEFSLWRDGELSGGIVRLVGDVESAGARLAAPNTLAPLFEQFLRWNPIPPRTAKELAVVSARLCRLLRDEVTEQMGLGSPALTSLAADWRKLLFPEATDEAFADGYAQAVTFGMLIARAKGIRLAEGLGKAAADLGDSNSLIGAALRLLTDNAENQSTLSTSLGTLTRVLDSISWTAISKGEADAWLYFYEDFLEVYDNTLRKKTGSYYTPPEVVQAMVQLVDECLRTRFGLHAGLASQNVTVADPAVGTGTFLLGVLRRIATAVEADDGAGAVPGAINAAVRRLIAFELQLGPFAVAQLRLHGEVVDLTGKPPKSPLRMFVTNTLGDPADDKDWFPGMLAPLAQSRRDANKIKREEPITVVIGNPPYKEKAKGLGGWVEQGVEGSDADPILNAWMPPAEWHVGAHSKHLRNLYVYFWRWATWKVFDHGTATGSGVVCFITVAGFLGGPGFQKMRDYLRRVCDDVWVIDCSPEGHQPDVPTRIFEGVQQPVCIVLASRKVKTRKTTPAHVRFRALPRGSRIEKFAALAAARIGDDGWADCPAEWRAPFLPSSTGPWATYPLLEKLFVYDGSGVMPGRTWIIAPDPESLLKRWGSLIRAPDPQKATLFHPHLRQGQPGDKHLHRPARAGLPGFESRLKPVAEERSESIPPVRYAFRSFDRQWIIPDVRVINQPNAHLWESRSDRQVFITAPSDRSPTDGPSLTISGLIPDLHHYNGRGGRVLPLWRDAAASTHNFHTKLLAALSAAMGPAVSPEDLMAYVACVAAHPAFTHRFREDLSTPGIRIPLTSDRKLFAEAVSVGRRVIWLHTFGERMADKSEGRPPAPPRMPPDRRPTIPAKGAIPDDAARFPNTMDYDPKTRRLHVGEGYVENVTEPVWNYTVSAKQVLVHWFSYRKANRERPIMGDRRPPSPLGDIQPESWLPEYTADLLDLLNVLGLLVELEPAQSKILERICSGPTISEQDLAALGALDASPAAPARAPDELAFDEDPA